MSNPNETDNRFTGLAALVGNTPLLQIALRYRGEDRVVYAKAEHYNLTGSIKDRIAYHILQQAYATGQIRTGEPIAEATSGNTGISFAAVGAYLGHPVTIFMPDWMSQERVNLIESFGAVVRPVSRAEGGFTGALALADQMGEEAGAFLPHQFANPENVAAHRLTTGPEIIAQLERFGQKPAAFVAGVGTGGTLMGVKQAMQAAYPACRAFPLDPANSPTLASGGKTFGPHRIAGIGDEFIPPIVRLEELEPVLMVDDGDAINMARRLARVLGLGVGISSGANFLGALLAQDRLGSAAEAVVTVFADDNKKYLSTDLAHEQPVRPEHLAPAVKLLGFRAVR